MEAEQYRFQLEETQKKLFALTTQLENVLKCNSKLGVGMDYVIATVNELQSLMEWTAGSKELKADSGIIFQKLRQLERIQKDLEMTTTESELIRYHAQQERSVSPSAANSCENVVATEELIEDPTYLQLESDKSATQTALFIENNLKNLESVDSFETQQILSQISEKSKFLAEFCASVNSESNINDKNVQARNFTRLQSKESNEDVHDSMGPNISEDEGLGEESRRGDSTGPSSFIEIHDTASEIAEINSGLPQTLIQTEPTITVSDDLDKNVIWIEDLKDSTNSLDICLCAIGNLSESLKAKENELLKLSAIQSDQKQIAALQDVIINFHKDSTHFKSLLQITEKENASLKEQVLELEEAENDARLQAQRLEEKLVFLQEKDSHFQAELADTKNTLEKCIEELTIKELEDQDLRAQLKYTEALVHKYEDQIRTLEAAELALRGKLTEQQEEIKRLKKYIAESVHETCERGSQTYDPNLKVEKLFEQTILAGVYTTSSPSSINECTISSQSSNSAGPTVNISEQVSEKTLTSFSQGVDCSVQTEIDVCSNLVQSHLCCSGETEFQASTISRCPVTEVQSEESNSALSNIKCPIQKELLKRLHQLVEEDAHLQQQLHYVDQINLTLWKKLHNLEFHIGECKKNNVSEDCGSDSCFESESCDPKSLYSRPTSTDQIMCDDSASTSKCESPSTNRGLIACLDQSEQEIKDRLLKLEKINASFEKELGVREKLYLDKESKYGEWIQTEQRYIGDLKRLEEERDSLATQVTKLENDKKELSARVFELQAELNSANDTHRILTSRIKAEQEEMTTQLQKKVEQLLAKEKEQLKQITNLRVERSKITDKTESEKLKASYVELQLELSRIRDEMYKMEEDFRSRLDEVRNKHLVEEARLVSELEMLHKKNTSFDEMINNYQLRHDELITILKQKEHELEEARIKYKKSMEVTEEEHRAIEAQLKSQLRKMEEGTAVATRALTEERVRLEKELQENLDDLRGKEEGYKARIAELESNVSHLHDELHRITGDLDSGFGDSEIGSENNSGAVASSFRREKLQNELRELRDREAELREKLDDMEQKEAAYRETLEHADRIVASVEQGYKNKIEELEISEKNLKQRVGHLEEVESRLRGALHKERRSSDGRKPDDLVTELLEAEVRETGLKEKIDALEHLQRSAMSKVRDLEKLREKLESQLGDKDELSSTLERTQQELDVSRRSLSRLKKSESDLQTSLQHAERALSVTESQMRNKLKTLEEEKKGLEETVDELRRQVRELRKVDRCPEEEDERVLIPKLQAPLCTNLLSRTNEIDDFDYAEIDEITPFNSSTTKDSNNASTWCRQVKKLENTDNVLAKKKTIPLQYVVPSVSANKEVFRDTRASTSFKSITPNKPSHTVDSCDSARQNLEDCVMRAMAAMTIDIQNKQMPKEQMKNRMKNQSAGIVRSSRQVSSTISENEDNDYDEVLPRPTDFRVVQQVGSDTLLIGWDYVNPSMLEGFQVYLDGHLHETVYTPDRTKALISGLNLQRPLQLGICALSRCGQMSEPVCLQLSPPLNGSLFQDEDEDEDSFLDDTVFEKQRPYSMEW